MEAYKLKRKQSDAEAWQSNMYTMCAVQTAVANVLLGKKTKVEYIKEPFLQNVKEETEEQNLSEKEKKKQREKLLMTLQLMQANFELNHSNSEEGRQDQ